MNIFKDFELKIELKEGVKPPTRGTEESAGLDFYSPANYTVKPSTDILIPLGVKIIMPKGFAMLLKEKSSIAVNKKLDIGACIIDSDYRGEIHVHFFNNLDSYQFIKKNQKIVQGVIFPIWLGEPIIVNSIEKNKTKRGSGGFGSTGE